MKTGDHGKDGTPFFADDPDALGRIYVGPYLKFAPELALILEDDQGVCGYALAVLDSRAFFDRYEREWRPQLCHRFPPPSGDSESWSRLESVYDLYHHPDYYCPEPYQQYPSHLHIDLLPRAQGQGHGRRMIEQLLERLRSRETPGVHLGMSVTNHDAYGFYVALGFGELVRHDDAIYLGMRFD
jgi:ribosomal protein S18 acetylase RimI-like enzyme